jgi:hypothetical protein
MPQAPAVSAGIISVNNHTTVTCGAAGILQRPRKRRRFSSKKIFAKVE